ncbi:uncharacterized protein LOC117900390 [Drosophila subobscura]|uniref:uncharacterized protein LOC117900390 n=1 Tax=Drosophila subobscura TaxID=7241 RepID=UPI00155A27B7|nr:uncharacterized protein LOC117900390 [Drosophila subobscura]
MQEVRLEMVRNRSRSRSSQRSRRGRKQKQKEAAARQAASSIMSGDIAQGTTTAEMWSNTYRRLFQWHHMQVQRLCQAQPTQQQEQLEESSASEAEEEATPIDEEYLQFLEVTIKHQQELKQRRAAAAATATPDSTLD